MLFEAEWAEADLPTPGQTRPEALTKRANLRAARFKLCWAATLRGPLRDAARQAIQAAAAAAVAAGGPGAANTQQRLFTELLPMLVGSSDDDEAGNMVGGTAGGQANGGDDGVGGSRERLTLGSLARRVCAVLGLRPDEAPPEATTGEDSSAGGGVGDLSEGGGGSGDSEVAGVATTTMDYGHSNGHLLISSARTREAGPSGIAAAALFADARSTSTSTGSTPTPVEGPAFSTPAATEDTNNVARDAQCADWLFGPRQAAWLAAETAGAAAAWRALDAGLSPATVLVASRASRGTEFSSVWARPDCLVWAKQAKNCYWPAMLLWGSKTNPALKEVNKGRVPPSFREELEKQVHIFWGGSRGGGREFETGRLRFFLFFFHIFMGDFSLSVLFNAHHTFFSSSGVFIYLFLEFSTWNSSGLPKYGPWLTCDRPQ